MTDQPAKTTTPPVLAEARRTAIATIARQRGVVTLEDIQRDFGVTPATARRYLVALERADVRAATVAEQESAASVVSEIESGEALFLDASVFALQVLRKLLDAGLRTTVITNGLALASVASQATSQSVDVILISGAFVADRGAFAGPSAESMISSHYGDRAFVTTGTGDEPDSLGRLRDAMARQVRTVVAFDPETGRCGIERTSGRFSAGS